MCRWLKSLVTNKLQVRRCNLARDDLLINVDLTVSIPIDESLFAGKLLSAIVFV